MLKFEFRFEDELRDALSSLENGRLYYDFIIDVGFLHIRIVSEDLMDIKVYPSIGGERVLMIGDYKERVPLTTRKILKKIMEIIEMDFYTEKRKIYEDEYDELVEEGYFFIERK